jgi:hypothetical protein
MTSRYDQEFEQRGQIVARLKVLEEAVNRIKPTSTAEYPTAG